MTGISSRKALRRRTQALFTFFFLPGLLMASRATRTPAIRDILSISTAEMGAVLFGLSIGSMSGILCSALAGETIWHAQSDPHYHVMCGHWDGYPQRGALAAFRGFSHLVWPCLAPALAQQKWPSMSKVRRLNAK